MKIAFYSVAHISHGGGFERQIVRLSEQLQKKGHEVVILSASADFTYYLTMFLSFIYFVPRFSFPEIKKTRKEFEKNRNIKVKEFHSIKHLQSLLHSVDVVYAKNEILDISFLRFAVNKTTPPIICGMHTLLSFTIIDGIHSWLHNILYKSPLYYALLKIFDGYHCINTDQVKILQKRVINKPIFYIPNFVQVQRKMKKIKKNIFTVLFVGRLSKQKGIDVFINVIEQMHKKRIKNIEFVICGGGPYKEKIKELARRLPNVMYKGSVTATEINDIYKTVNVFCITSCGEAFPVATMEALSFGVPIVGFNMPGLRDIIQQGRNGYLVKPQNSKDIIKKILLIKSLPEKKYMDMVVYSQNKIKQMYSVEKLLPQYDIMFKSVKEYEKEKIR